MKIKRPPKSRILPPPAVALFVLVTLGAGVAAARNGPPTFYIETITVEAPRLSPEIVLSESLLREGAEYTEDQLSEAVHRINRLPFVLLAEFSLRKGSARGRYELVITVFEARRWFFQFGGEWELDESRSVDPLDPRVDQLRGDRIGDTTDDAYSLVGRRFAVGRTGLLFASLATEDGAFAVGYQRYDLWDNNVLLSVSVSGKEEIGNVHFGRSTLTTRVQLGIPIRGNHAVRLLAHRADRDYDFLSGLGIDLSETEAEVAWVFNSLDDPVLPREGFVYEAGLTWLDTKHTQTLVDVEGAVRRLDFSDRGLGIIASAGRYWSVGRSQSVSTGVRGFVGDRASEADVWEAEARVGHQVFLLRRREPGKWRELRFETQLSRLHQGFAAGTAARELGFPDTAVDAWQARAGLTYRNGWGSFRLFVSYLDREIR